MVKEAAHQFRKCALTQLISIFTAFPLQSVTEMQQIFL